MDLLTIITAMTLFLGALAAIGEVVFKFWREKRRDVEKRPRK